MSIELLYTSAPQGLKQGSRGFCTVVSTVGLPINLAQRLESLSGYRHLYQPGDQRDSDNPVCYSHLKLNVGGQTVSILSRITAYGVDYSQRTNKIAHHVVLDIKLPACGPAAVLAQSGIMRSQWDGQCRTLPVGPTIPALSAPAVPCRLWEKIAGDAGWAGVVANAWLQPVGKPTWVIFSESQSQSMLTLMQEAIAILPESKRWQATFSTYCTNLAPDVDCRVRCVIAGSDEARMAIARGTVLDLTKGLGEPPVNPATNAAQMGAVVGEVERRTPGKDLSSTATIDSDGDDFRTLNDAVEESSIRSVEPEYEIVLQDLAQVPPSLLRSKPNRTVPTRLSNGSNTHEKERKSKNLLYASVASVSVLVFIVLWVGVYWLMGISPSSDYASNDVGIETPEQAPMQIAQQATDPVKDATSHSTDPILNESLPTVPTPPTKLELKLEYAKPFAKDKIATIYESRMDKAVDIARLQLVSDGKGTKIDLDKVIFKNKDPNAPPDLPSWILIKPDGTVTCTVDSVAKLTVPEIRLDYAVTYPDGEKLLTENISIKVVNENDPDVKFSIVDSKGLQSDFFIPGTILKPYYAVESDADEVGNSREWQWHVLDEKGNLINPPISSNPEYTVTTEDVGKTLQLHLRYKVTNNKDQPQVDIVSAEVHTFLPAKAMIVFDEMIREPIGSLYASVEIPLPKLVNDDSNGIQYVFSGSTEKRSVEGSKVVFKKILFDSIRQRKPSDSELPLPLLAEAKLATEQLVLDIKAYRENLQDKQTKFFSELKRINGLQARLDAKLIPVKWELRRSITEVISFASKVDDSKPEEQLDFIVRWKSLSRVLQRLDAYFDHEYPTTTETEKREEETKTQRTKKSAILLQDAIDAIKTELQQEPKSFYTDKKEVAAAIKAFAVVWKNLQRQEEPQTPSYSTDWDFLSARFNDFEKSILQRVNDINNPVFIGYLEINKVGTGADLISRPKLILKLPVMAKVWLDDSRSIRSELRDFNRLPK